MKSPCLAGVLILVSLMARAQEQTATTAVESNIAGFTKFGGMAGATGGIETVSGHNIEGKRLLFDNWVKGAVLTTNHVTFSSNYLYNFDLYADELLIKPIDSLTVLIVDKEQTLSFQLENKGRKYTFERRVNFEKKDETSYYQVIGKGKKYSLFKENKVKLQKADPYDRSQYVRGVIYDEYLREEYYYLLTADGSQHSFKMNKKNLYKAFVQEGSRLDKYFASQEEGTLDDDFLSGLLVYMNE